jgi:MtN3 and saliva related transmembrane protein
MFLSVDQLGYAAAFLTTSAFVPQVLMVWRQRGAPGISSGMYSLFIVGITLWLFYGLALESLPIIIANGVTLLLATSVLGMKWYFERR